MSGSMASIDLLCRNTRFRQNRAAVTLQRLENLTIFSPFNIEAFYSKAYFPRVPDRLHHLRHPFQSP
jgi:hypothetical protein